MQVEIDFGYLNSLTDILTKVHVSGDTSVNDMFVPVTIAGGAIRDMLLGKPVADIDVFYEKNLSDLRLKTFFHKVEPQLYGNYPDGFNVTHKVWIENIPVPIQLIQVENIETHIDKFPCKFSRVQFSIEKGLSGVDIDFVDDVEKKEFVWDSKVNAQYYDKMKVKYSDWKHVFLSEQDNPYYELASLEF